MKRLILLLIAIVLLSACGRNESISEEMYKDTNQVLTLIDAAIDNKRESTSSEWDTLIEYEVKYDNMYDDKKLSDDERLLKAHMDLIMMLNDPDNYTLDTVDDSITVEIVWVKKFMETGEF